MKNTTALRSLLVAVVLSTACGSDTWQPTAPTDTASTPPPATVGTPPAFPAVSRPARVYVGPDSLYPSTAMHGSSIASRYVLYDDHTFELDFASVNYPFFAYRGTYTEENGAITFVWGDSSVGSPWGATGVVNEDSLAVRYNQNMLMSDFVDGVYVRTQ